MINFSPFVVLVAERAEQSQRADRERKPSALIIKRCECQKEKEPASKMPKLVEALDQPSNYLPSK